MIVVGQEVLDGDVVVATFNEDNDETEVTFNNISDPAGNRMVLRYYPAVTQAFIVAQVDAILHGQVPPFVTS